MEKYEVQIVTNRAADDAQTALRQTLFDIDSKRRKNSAASAIVKNTKTGEVVVIDIATRQVFDRWTEATRKGRIISC